MGKRTRSNLTRVPLVSILLNQKDVDRRIRVEHVYCRLERVDAGHDVFKFYIVFTNEIHPWPLVNAAYQIYRRHHYGSEFDISPLFIVVPRELGNIRIFYEDAKDQPFDVPIPTHYPTAVTIPRSEQCIFASTWNHLFSRQGATSCAAQVEDLPDTYANEQLFDARFKDFENFYLAYNHTDKTISSDYVAEFFTDLLKKIRLYYGGDIKAFEQDMILKRSFTKFQFLT